MKSNLDIIKEYINPNNIYECSMLWQGISEYRLELYIQPRLATNYNEVEWFINKVIDPYPLHDQRSNREDHILEVKVVKSAIIIYIANNDKVILIKPLEEVLVGQKDTNYFSCLLGRDIKIKRDYSNEY